MNFPPMLHRLKGIAACERSGARWRLTCAGTPGWCMELPHGLCVALAVERTGYDDEWLVRATLSLATLPGALDDGLVLEGEGLWLARRYAPELDAADFESALLQQHAVARWLAGKERDAPSFAGARQGATT